MKGSLRRALVVVFATGCGTSQAVYPPRPPAVPGLAVADPAPSRVVVHATVTGAALKQELDLQIPKNGSGSFRAVGSDHKYVWSRQGVEVAFAAGRIDVKAHVEATVEALGTAMDFPIDLDIAAEPVVSSDYRARLQAPTVNVTTTSSKLRVAQWLGGALDSIRDQIAAEVRDFSYDLRPLIAEAHGRIARPIDLPLGGARGCATLTVLGVEAGPTVLADGIEKDLAVVVAPSVTLPCAWPDRAPELPPLANVAALPTGPFTVAAPVAARYEELQKAMVLAFTDGKLYFSKEFPRLYMEKPEVYASKDQLVLKLHIVGPIEKYGIHAMLDGDLYMVGHPTVVDNEIRVPDLQPTVETQSFLLRLKAALDGDSIRDQAREALHLDIGDRLAEVRRKLSSDLTFGDNRGCLRSTVSKIEITGVHAHPTYLRVYVALTGQASVYMPCPSAAVSAR